MTYAVVILALAVAVQGLVIVRLSKALRAVTRFGERLAHLAAAMELLTDTTEAGLGNVAAELERVATSARPARPTRGMTARRIATAARRGQSVEEIAAAEALSHGEVRLHLQLAPGADTGGRHGALRG